MTPTDIPEDVFLKAQQAAGRITTRDEAAIVIARAILAERHRCSGQVYTVGDETMARVFKPAGLTNVSDLQAVLDAVEAALVAAANAEDDREHQQGAEADFQSHVSQIKRERDWE